MPRQNQADSGRFGFESTMKPTFAGDEHVGLGTPGVGEKVVPRAATDGDSSDFSLGIADELHSCRPETLSNRLGKIRESGRRKQPADSTCPPF